MHLWRLVEESAECLLRHRKGLCHAEDIEGESGARQLGSHLNTQHTQHCILNAVLCNLAHMQPGSLAGEGWRHLASGPQSGAAVISASRQRSEIERTRRSAPGAAGLRQHTMASDMKTLLAFYAQHKCSMPHGSCVYSARQHPCPAIWQCPDTTIGKPAQAGCCSLA